MVQKINNIDLEIVELLLKKDNHIRGIAKELDESHSTILRKLKNLKEKKAIDFRTEGKNKIFFLNKNLITRNYILEAELYKLNKLLWKHPELQVVFEEILKKTDKKLIILFGSYAKESEIKDSDIDIYIETDNRKEKTLIEGIYSKINVKIGPFNNKSPLIQEIIKDHIIIRGVEAFYDKQVSK